jgi:hypothetical protein
MNNKHFLKKELQTISSPVAAQGGQETGAQQEG